MLEKGIRIILYLSLCSCSQRPSLEELNFAIYNTSISVVGYTEYNKVRSALEDSVKHWGNNQIGTLCIDTSVCETFLDTLICFDSNGNRLISAILQQSKIMPNPGGGLSYILGEKINDKWFFFRENVNIELPYSLKKEIHFPYFSPSELHSLSLKFLFSNYMVGTNTINKAWFINHFEGPGWGVFEEQGSESDWYLKGRRFKTKKEFYEAMHLDKVRNNWLSRDTTKPIVPLTPNNLP